MQIYKVKLLCGEITKPRPFSKMGASMIAMQATICSLSVDASTTRAPSPPKSWRMTTHLYQLNLVCLLVPISFWVLQGQYLGEPKHVYLTCLAQQNKIFSNALCGHNECICKFYHYHTCRHAYVCVHVCVIQMHVGDECVSLRLFLWETQMQICLNQMHTS